MFRVGLTGNIASGKSAVARVWQRLGAHIVDADELARNAVERESAGLRRVVERFGPGVLEEDGSLDRAALRAIVFDDDTARAALEQILHPEINRLRQAEEERFERSGECIVVHMVPLLFEAGLAERCDVIVLVDAPVDVRLRRIVETRGVDEVEARRMIAAQMPAAQKRARADIVIDNDGPLARLEARAGEVWNDIEAQAR